MKPLIMACVISFINGQNPLKVIHHSLEQEFKGCKIEIGGWLLAASCQGGVKGEMVLI